MDVHTRMRLCRIAGLILTLPIAFLLFAVAVSIDAGVVVGSLVVFVPLGLFGAGVALLLRGMAPGEDASPTDASTDHT